MRKERAARLKELKAATRAASEMVKACLQKSNEATPEGTLTAAQSQAQAQKQSTRAQQEERGSTAHMWGPGLAQFARESALA